MNRRERMKRAWVASMLGSGMALALMSYSGVSVADGLIEVDQRVFGMDCAPCAYGVEQGLKGLTGVVSVTVSLNQGKAVVRFGSDSDATLVQIREIIRKNGFTPKDAAIQVMGRLARTGEDLDLIVDSSQRYRLNPEVTAAPAWEALQHASAGARIQLTGRVPESKNDATLYVTGVSLLRNDGSPG